MTSRCPIFAAPDFAAPDLADADLSPAPDLLIAFCAGTGLAGTCVQAFFAPLMDCFQPTGACTDSNVDTFPSYCWPNGMVIHVGHGPGEETIDYENNGSTCYSYLFAAWGTTATAGNTMIDFNRQSGDYSCGGVSGNVGANCGGCVELCNLLQPDVTIEPNCQLDPACH